MRLIYNNESHTTESPPGVQIVVPGWGNTAEIENIDRSSSIFGEFFKIICDKLVCTGLERNLSIRGAPYDFRKAPSKT